MKIGVVSKSNGGVDYHRLLKPFSLMTQHEVIRCEGISSEVFDYNFDVVVFNRILPIVKQKEFIKELRKRGTYVICDIDDYWILNSGHVSKKASDSFRKQSIEALMYSDEVWVTNQHLANYVEKLNDHYYLIPNALDPNEPQWQPKKEYGTRIGWAGGVTHFEDLMLTKDAWVDVKPVICGFTDNNEWRRLADKFEADYINALDVYNYGLLYETFDIAIAPLVDNKFNKCKSNLKIIEAGMKGLPILAQNIHPYIDRCEGVILVDDWSDAINKARQLTVDNIKELGGACREYVLKNYNLHEVNKIRLERLEGIYKSI